MTTFSGKFAKTFSEANAAISIGVHMNGDYHFFFEIVKVEPQRVTLKSLKDGSVWEKKIVRRAGEEWTSYEHSGLYQQIFRAKPERVRVVPFKREVKP